MATTYTLISSNVLTSSAASVTFSSIPATYTDLVVKMSTRSDTTNRTITINFNNDTGTNYSVISLQGSGSTAASPIASGQTYSYINDNARSDYTANTFANTEFYIPNYLASTNKPLSIFGASENNATTAYIIAVASLWRNTSAITSITISDVSNFVSGSSFYLYGIKNS